MVALRNDYFLWLIERIDVGYVDVNEYNLLLEYLFDRDYTWLLELDGNLAAHGLNLRYQFDPYFDLGPKSCSVLEMMIALAWNWEHDITYDFQIGDRSGLWFWVMIENLGLDSMTDDSFDEDLVENVVSTWLNREFDYNGIGSAFPLDKANRDQRDLIIWLQVNDFVMENVEI